MVRATSPTLVTPTLGVASATSLSFGAGVSARRIILNTGLGNDFQYYGFGIAAFTQKYQVETSSSNHIFYAGTSSTTETELFRVKGTGGFTSAGDSSVTGVLTASTVSATSRLNIDASVLVLNLTRLVIPLPNPLTRSCSIRLHFYTSVTSNVTLSSNTAADGSGTNFTVFENLETTTVANGDITVTSNGILSPSMSGANWAYSIIEIATQPSTTASRFSYTITTVYSNSTILSCQNVAFGHVVPSSRSLIFTPSAGTISGRWNITSY